jgi:hypothetical protein
VPSDVSLVRNSSGECASLSALTSGHHRSSKILPVNDTREENDRKVEDDQR